jgi:hypothetical protein
VTKDDGLHLAPDGVVAAKTVEASIRHGEEELNSAPQLLPDTLNVWVLVASTRVLGKGPK